MWFAIGLQKIPSPQSLQTALASITDPRAATRSEHRLLDILMIAICCLLCGGQSFTHMEQFGHANPHLSHARVGATFLSRPAQADRGRNAAPTTPQSVPTGCGV